MIPAAKTINPWNSNVNILCVSIPFYKSHLH